MSYRFCKSNIDPSLVCTYTYGSLSRILRSLFSFEFCSVARVHGEGLGVKGVNPSLVRAYRGILQKNERETIFDLIVTSAVKPMSEFETVTRLSRCPLPHRSPPP